VHNRERVGRRRRASFGLGALALAAALAVQPAAAADAPPGVSPARQPLGIPGLHARWAEQSAYLPAGPGQAGALVIALRNTGSVGWVKDTAVRLGTAAPLDSLAWEAWRTPDWVGDARPATQSTEYVGPGQLGWFRTTFRVPLGTPAGRYQIALRPVVDGLSWLEDEGTYHEIAVPFSAYAPSDAGGVHVFGERLDHAAAAGTVRFLPSDGGPTRQFAFSTDQAGRYDVDASFSAAAHTFSAPGAVSIPRGTYYVSITFDALGGLGPLTGYAATSGTHAPPAGAPPPPPLPLAGLAATSVAPPLPEATPLPTASPSAAPAPMPLRAPSPSTAPAAAPLAAPSPVTAPAPMPLPAASPNTAPAATLLPAAGGGGVAPAPSGSAGVPAPAGGGAPASAAPAPAPVSYEPPPAPTTSLSAPAAAGAAFTLTATYTDLIGNRVTTLDLYVTCPGSAATILAATHPLGGGTSSGGASSGGARGTDTFTYTPTGGEGTYRFVVVATDAAGLRSGASDGPAQASVIYDATPATATASGPALSNAAFTITAGYSDALSGATSVALYAKGPGDAAFVLAATQPFAASSSGTRSFTYSPALGDGTYAFYAVATDAVGNVQATPDTAQASTVYDATAPTAAAGAATPTATSPFALTATFSDATSGVASVALWVKPPGDSGYAQTAGYAAASVPSGSTVFTYAAALGEGTYAFCALATDDAGNVQATPDTAQASVVYDVSPPTATASSPAYAGGGFTVSVPYGDAASGTTSVGLYVKRPGDAAFGLAATQSFAASLAGTSSFTYTPALGEGAYGFYAVATDAVGHVQATPAPQSSTFYDATAPSTAIAALPAYEPATFTLSVAYSDAASGVTSVTLYDNGVSYATQTFAASTSGTRSFGYAGAGGAHAFTARATDAAGNVQAVPAAQASTTIDTTAPSAGAASLPAYETTSTLTLAVGYSDGGSGVTSVTLYADGVAYSTQSFAASGGGTLGFSYTGGQGAHTFYARATDAVGNVQAAPGTQASTTIDTVAPGTPIISFSPAIANNPAGLTIAVNVSFSDATGGVSSVRLYNGAGFVHGTASVANLTSGTAAFSYSGTSVWVSGWSYGPNQFSADATDAAGNVSARAWGTFYIDTSSPVCANASPGNAYNWSNGTLTIGGGCTDDYSFSSFTVYGAWDFSDGACSPGYCYKYVPVGTFTTSGQSQTLVVTPPNPSAGYPSWGGCSPTGTGMPRWFYITMQSTDGAGNTRPRARDGVFDWGTAIAAQGGYCRP